MGGKSSAIPHDAAVDATREIRAGHPTPRVSEPVVNPLTSTVPTLFTHTTHGHAMTTAMTLLQTQEQRLRRETTWGDIGPATLIVDTANTFVSSDGVRPPVRIHAILHDVKKQRLLDTIRLVAFWAGPARYSVPLSGTVEVCRCACKPAPGIDHFMCPAHSSRLDVHTEIEFRTQPVTRDGKEYYSITATMAPIEIPSADAPAAAAGFTLEFSQCVVDDGSSACFLTRNVMRAVADHFSGVSSASPGVTRVGTTLSKKPVHVEVVPMPGAAVRPGRGVRPLPGVSIIATASPDFDKERDYFLAVEVMKDERVRARFNERTLPLSMHVVESDALFTVIVRAAYAAE